MITPVPIALNLNNLKSVFGLLSGIEAFVFFGTLLGYTREGNIIEGDDDIDIYVNAKHRRKLVRELRKSDFDVKVMPRKKWYHWRKKPLIVQASRLQNGIQTFADFYLYDDRPAKYVIDRWNFKGFWRDPATTLHVPKDLIFPLRSAVMQGIDIKIPAKPEGVCSFLYGPSWKTPANKSGGYTIEIVKNQPVFRLK